MISTVLFDLGDVVARYDPAPRIARYAERSGRTPEEVIARLVESGFADDCDRGAYSARGMQAAICRRLGCLFSRDELLDLQAAAFRVRPGVLALASRVTRRARTGLLTNNAPLLEEAFPLRFPQLCETFDPILFSYAFGDTKPSVSLFEKVAERLEARPPEILLIDDQQRHVDGAQSAGWDAIAYRSQPQLQQALAARNLLDP